MATVTETNTDGWSRMNVLGVHQWTAFIPGKSITGTAHDADAAEREARSALARLKAERGDEVGP